MNDPDKIKRINAVLTDFFNNNSTVQKIPAKDLMPMFIKNGIFDKDDKDRPGVPIRNLLRELDKDDNLSAIPYVLADRKNKNTNWFFVNTNPMHTEQNKSKFKTCLDPILRFFKNYFRRNRDFHLQTSAQTQNRKLKSTNATQHSRVNSDEYYVINLCNEVLGREASKQHKFDFLKGDSGRRLPVDAFYQDLNLVVEYCESQHTESVPFFDRKETVSGVSRGEQRKLYDERRRNILPEHGIKLIEIHYSDFGEAKHIQRDYKKDKEIVRRLLKDFL